MPDQDTPALERLMALVLNLQQQVVQLSARVTELEAKNAALRDEIGKKGGSPSWAKANTPRKKRAHGASQ